MAMSQTDHRDLWGGTSQVCTNLLRNFSPLLQNYVVDSHRSHCKGGSNFGDSTGPFFPLYSEIAEEEDNKVTGHWQQDATDGILVFVGPHVRNLCHYAHKLEHRRLVIFLQL